MRQRWLLLSIMAGLLGCERPVATPPGAADAPASVSVEPLPSPSGAPPATPTATARDAAAGPAFAGTAGITEKKRVLAKPVVLAAVRAARHAGFDRVVFEFEGTELPGHHLEYVDRPLRRCGSGHTVEVAGDGWLRVRLEQAAAHDERGKATIAERDRQRKLSLHVLRELVLTCDFEGQVVWVLGVASPNRYRVAELMHPPRLVVDIRQR